MRKIIESQISSLKMGGNQFEKFAKEDRNNLIKAAYLTLVQPSIVIEKDSYDRIADTFKPLHIYGKSFYRIESGNKRVVESVVVFKDENNVVIGSHNKDIDSFVKQIKTADQIIFADSEISRMITQLNKEVGNPVSLYGMNTEALNPKYDKKLILSTMERRTAVVQKEELIPQLTKENARLKEEELRLGKQIFEYQKENYEEEHIRRDLFYISEIFKTGDSLIVKNKDVGRIYIDKGNIGKSGNGLQHIIEQRFEKNNKTVDEITAILCLVMNATEDGKVSRNVEVFQNDIDIGTLDIEKNGIISFVSKTRDGEDEKFVITGFDDFSKKEEAGDAIKAVIAENSYAPEFVIVKKQVVATLASSYILHLDEIKCNLEVGNKKKVIWEVDRIKNYENSNELKNYFCSEKNYSKYKEATDAVNTVSVKYGYTPEFLSVGKQVGAVIASVNMIALKNQMSSVNKNITRLTEENARLKEENLRLGKQIFEYQKEKLLSQKLSVNKNNIKSKEPKDKSYGYER